jgi:iron complex outermembrane receptor protein
LKPLLNDRPWWAFAFGAGLIITGLPLQALGQTQLAPITVDEGNRRPVRASRVPQAGSQPVQESRAAPEAPRPVGDSSSTRNEIFDPVSSTATKTETTVIETPQAISTVTRKQLDDQSPQTVTQALRYTAGVLSAEDATSRYDSIFMRGFGGFGLSTNYVNFLDGLKLPRGQAFAVMSIDPFLLDRVDVIKGPSALLYGQINPGGLVNQVSRQPSATPYNEFRIEGGTFGRIQSGFTSQGALDAAGHWQYSFTGIGRSSGTRYDDVDEKRVAVAPALAWQPTNDTRITVFGLYQKDPEGGYFNSLYPNFLGPDQYRPYLNSRLNPGDPGFDSFKREQSGIGYKLEHRFSNALTFRSTLRYADIDINFQSLQMAAPITANGYLPRWAVRSIEDGSGLSADNHLQFDFGTGPLVHKVLAGVDYQQSQSNWIYQLGGATALNVVNPQYYIPVAPLTTLIDSHQTLYQAGMYVQDQISVGGWRAVLGARRDLTEQTTDNRLSLTSSKQEADKSSYRAGLLYLFDNGLAPYASYSTSFEPVIGVDAAGKPFVPTTAEQSEAGIKYQPAFMNALFTVAAFDITQQNVRVPGPNPNFSVQQGEILSRGLEFEARGKLSANLEMIAAYTLLDTEVTQSTVPSVIGKRPQAVPDNFGGVWANYSFLAGMFDGLTLGGGVRVRRIELCGRRKPHPDSWIYRVRRCVAVQPGEAACLAERL